MCVYVYVTVVYIRITEYVIYGFELCVGLDKNNEWSSSILVKLAVVLAKLTERPQSVCTMGGRFTVTGGG